VRKKWLNLLLVLASLLGYLQWGGAQSAFLFQVEWQLVARAFRDPASVLHPFTLLPVLGQTALLWTLTQTTPSRVLTYTGIAGIGLLLSLMFLIGLLSMNLRILGSTIPFLTLAVLAVREHRRTKDLT
jgi:hypothetical protein